MEVRSFSMGAIDFEKDSLLFPGLNCLAVIGPGTKRALCEGLDLSTSLRPLMNNSVLSFSLIIMFLSFSHVMAHS